MGCVLAYPDCIQTCCTAPISLTSKTDDNIEDHSRTVLVKVALKPLSAEQVARSTAGFCHLAQRNKKHQKTSQKQTVILSGATSKHESNEVTGVTLHAALNLTWKVHSLYHLPRFPSHPRLCDLPIPILNVQLLARDEYCAS